MSTKTKTKWRLSQLPEPSEVVELLKADILTKDEAREILISLETEEDRTKKSLQEEIKFLRELVAKLTTNRSVILEGIRYIEKPYKQYDWYQPYYMYANAAQTGVGSTYLTSSGGLTTATGGATTGATTGAIYSLNSSALNQSAQAQQLSGSAPSDFTNIKTF